MAELEGEAQEIAASAESAGRASKPARFFRRVLSLLRPLALFVTRVAGAVFLGGVIVFFVAPPVVLMILLTAGGVSVPPELPSGVLTNVLLTATGTTAAFAALCFSYSRAVEREESKRAGLTSGRFLLGAAVALSVAMAAHFFDSLPVTALQDEPNAFLRFVIDRSLAATLTAAPALIAFALIRMYFHLVRLASIAYVHTYDTSANRAERDKLRLFD